MPTEFVIPGLNFLSKKLKIGRRATGVNLLEKDLALYDQKAGDYFSQVVEEARRNDRTELKFSDPLKFWLTQVIDWHRLLLIWHFFLNIRRTPRTSELDWLHSPKTFLLSRPRQSHQRDCSPYRVFWARTGSPGSLLTIWRGVSWSRQTHTSDVFVETDFFLTEIYKINFQFIYPVCLTILYSDLASIYTQ